MAGLVAVALCVGAVSVVALAYAVVSLRSRVDSLSRRIDAVDPTSGLATPAPRQSKAAARRAQKQPPGPESPVAEQARRPGEQPVALITGMAATSDRPEGIDASMMRVASLTLAGPLIKVAALSYGVQHALREESRMRIGYAVRRELKRQRKLRRRQSARRAAWGTSQSAAQGWRS